MILLWSLYSTIWLPYLDSRRSYRQLVQAVALHLLQTGCVASRNLGEPQGALFYYYAGLATQRLETHPDADCPILLVQYGHLDGPPPDVAGYVLEWDGHRRGDDTENYALYRRRSS